MDVAASADDLARIAHTEGHHGLRRWYAENGGEDSGKGFAAFKAALERVGLDYDTIKTGWQEVAGERLAAAATHEIRLASAATDTRFAITTWDGTEVWYGNHHPDAKIRTAEDGELDAAKKAIWIAKKASEEKSFDMLGDPCTILCRLTVSYPDIDVEALNATAAKAGVGLTVDIEPAVPAEKPLELRYWQNWQDAGILTLVAPIDDTPTGGDLSADLADTVDVDDIDFSEVDA